MTICVQNLAAAGFFYASIKAESRKQKAESRKDYGNKTEDKRQEREIAENFRSLKMMRHR